MANPKCTWSKEIQDLYIDLFVVQGKQVKSTYYGDEGEPFRDAGISLTALYCIKFNAGKEFLKAIERAELVALQKFAISQRSRIARNDEDYKEANVALDRFDKKIQDLIRKHGSEEDKELLNSEDSTGRKGFAIQFEPL